MATASLRRCCAAALLTLAALRPATLRGQSPADRTALLAFIDTLTQISTADALQPLADQKVSGPVGFLRAGLIARRRGDLGTDRGPYDQALQPIERALDAESKWPFAWYVLGLTQLSEYQQGFIAKVSHYTQSGMSYREAAIRSFSRGIEVDSTFAPNANALAAIVLSLGHRLLPKALAEPLARAALVPTVAPEVQLAGANVAFALQDYPRGLDLLGDYLRRGGDSALARLEQARTLTALGRPDEGVASYLEGLKHLSEVGRLAYREDIAWVAGGDELAVFDSLPAAQLQPWMERFWRERDALNLRAPNERLAEHLRRWVYAHEHFLTHRPDDVPANAEGFGPQDQASLYEVGAIADVMVEVAGGIPAFRSYRRTQWELDDRGVMYIRHGEPTKRVRSVAGPPNESWAYDLPEGRRIFHFLGSRALGTQDATTLTASLPLDPAMLDARAELDGRYAALADRIERLQAQARTYQSLEQAATRATGAGGAQADQLLVSPEGPRLGADVLWREVMRGRTAIAAAVASDGFPPHYKTSLDAIVQVYGVGFGDGERRRILTVFAVPGEKLQPRPRPDGGPGMLYPVAFRVIALDRLTGVVRQLDTTRVFLTRDTLRGDQHLTGLLELPVPPGSYQVRAMVTQPGLDAGTGVGTDSIQIPASPKAIILSDLILGRQESGLTWRYGTDQVPLNPLNAIPKGGGVELFYEVGGLAKDRKYQVTSEVRRPDDKPTAKPQLQVAFDFTASADYERVSRGLGLSNLKPGSYLLRVTVREAGSDRAATRERVINILSR